MLVIVDNGRNAEEISKFLRVKYEIIPPNKIDSIKASAYVLSDGDVKHKAHNLKLIEHSKKPVLGIGAGSVFIGVALGAKIKEGKTEKSKTIKVKKACPLLLNFKKVFGANDECKYILDDVPEQIDPVAESSNYDYEVFQHAERPLFGVHFSPTGQNCSEILNNFVKFVEIWEKYHK
ncbi:MAG: hypothetical protein V1802_03445 [Candidatus Aenigmatarchaeota archaeon]